MILGFGEETSENVKIELPCRRELNFRGSGTLVIELFSRFLGCTISVEKGTRPRCLKIGSSGSLGAPREGPRAKMGSTRVPPRRAPGSPRGSKIKSKSKSFFQCPEVGSKTSPQGCPGDHFGSIFDDFGIDF